MKPGTLALIVYGFAATAAALWRQDLCTQRQEIAVAQFCTDCYMCPAKEAHMVIMLISKTSTRKFDPHTVTPSMALDDWLAKHFNIIGPLESEDDAIKTAEELSDDRYWCVLELGAQSEA